MAYLEQTIQPDGMRQMATTQSPCILVCSIDMKTGLCFGCARTRDEISGWMNYSDNERSLIMASLEERMKTIEQKPRRETKRRRMRREQAQG